MSEPRRIHVLDEHLAQKIAAGEVVDRPSSVIKELIENSIDADATSISIEIKDGGKSYICVSDNGSGINEDDMPLAFTRHATSKIATINDLYNIQMMGFRGEALYSISAVSKVTLISKKSSADNGSMIVVEGGSIKKHHVFGCPNGTNIEIKDLFYNTPARMKFLKSTGAETAQISQIIQKFILAYPGLSFKFINNGKVIYHSMGDGNQLNAVSCIYGPETAGNCVELVDIQSPDQSIRLKGCLGNRYTLTKTTLNQSLYVNHRYVKNKAIQRVVENIYSQLLMKHVHPFFVLDIIIDPMLIDVNVHPQKLIVKFSNEKQITQSINDLLRPIVRNFEKQYTQFYHREASVKPVKSSIDQIQTATTKPTEKQSQHNTSEPSRSDNSTPSGNARDSIHSKSIAKNQSAPTIERASDKPVSVKTHSADAEHIVVPKDLQIDIDNDDKKISHKQDPPTDPYVNDRETVLHDLHHYNYRSQLILNKKPHHTNALRQSVQQVRSGKDHVTKQVDETLIDKEYEHYRVIGSVFETYIVVEFQDSVFFIDQHAAHERLIFKKFMETLSNEAIRSQVLLIPQEIILPYDRYLFLEENYALFEDIGFQIDIQKDSKVSIHAVPIILGQPRLNTFFDELLVSVYEERDPALIKEKLISMSCKKAVKAGDSLSGMEISELLRNILEENITLTCPHGRPFVMKISQKELESRFGRIQ